MEGEDLARLGQYQSVHGMRQAAQLLWGGREGRLRLPLLKLGLCYLRPDRTGRPCPINLWAAWQYLKAPLQLCSWLHPTPRKAHEYGLGGKRASVSLPPSSAYLSVGPHIEFQMRCHTFAQDHFLRVQICVLLPHSHIVSQGSWDTT